MGKVVIKRDKSNGQHTVVVERYGYHHSHKRVSAESMKRLNTILLPFPGRAVFSTNSHIETTVQV